MTNAEMKKALKELGLADTDIAKVSKNILELVAGGSAVGDWLSKNWKGIVIGIAVGFLLGGAGVAAHAIGIHTSGAISTILTSTALAIPSGGMALAGMSGIGGVAIMAGTIAAGAAAGGAVSHFIGD